MDFTQNYLICGRRFESLLILFQAVNYGFVIVKKITKMISLEISLKREQSRYYDNSLFCFNLDVSQSNLKMRKSTFSISRTFLNIFTHFLGFLKSFH